MATFEIKIKPIVIKQLDELVNKLEIIINDPNNIDNNIRSKEKELKREDVINLFKKLIDILEFINYACIEYDIGDKYLKLKQLQANYLKTIIKYEVDCHIYIYIDNFITIYNLEHSYNDSSESHKDNRICRNMPRRTDVKSSSDDMQLLNRHFDDFKNNASFFMKDSSLADFACFYDKEASTSSAIFLNFAVFEKEFEKEIKEMLDDKIYKSTGRRKIQKGNKYKVILTSPDINNIKDEKEFIWYGEYNILDYLINVPNYYNKDDIKFIFTVKSYDLIIAELIISINIKNRIINSNEKKNKYAFISYSREDRLFVEFYKNIIEQMGYRVFYDNESLRHGDIWPDEIDKAIREANYLFLFWSESARKSEYVKKEYEAMIASHGIESIKIIPLCNINPEELPNELNKIHIDKKLCNDVLNKLKEVVNPF